MRLSYSLPITTGIILILTAVVNITAFQVSSERYFSRYVSELSDVSGSPDPDRLGALLQIGKLDKLDQLEYAAILAELSNLTKSIENIGENPELYMTEKTASGDMMFALPVSSQRGFDIFRLSALSLETPE